MKETHYLFTRTIKNTDGLNEERKLKCEFIGETCVLSSSEKSDPNIQKAPAFVAGMRLICECLKDGTLNSINQNDFAQKTNCSIDSVKNNFGRTDCKISKLLNDLEFDNGDAQASIYYNGLYNGTRFKVVEKENELEDTNENEEEYPQNVSVSDTRNDAFDFDKFIDYWCGRGNSSHVFLFSPGGKGKTHFMKKIYKKLKFDPEKSTKIHFCSLALLLQEAINNPIKPVAHCKGDLSRASEKTSYILRHESIFKMPESCVFFLDGFNELLDQNGSLTYNYVMQIISEINMLIDAPYTKLMISSREKNDSQFFEKLCKSNFSFVELGGIFDDDIEKNDDITAEVKKMLSYPIFYNIYKKTKDKKVFTSVSSKYSLWNSFHISSCKQSFENKNLLADSMLYLYYILLPCAAYWMESNRKTRISMKQCILIIDKIRNSLILQEFYANIINDILFTDKDGKTVKREEIQFNKISLIYYEGLRNLQDFIIFSDEEKYIEFKHQDIREYFAAFYIVSHINGIINTSVTHTLDMVPSFNLKTDVQNMIKEQFELKTEDGESFIRLFKKTTELYPSTSHEDIQLQLRENIIVSYTAHTLSDHFILHVNSALMSFLEPFVSSLLKHEKFFKNWNNTLTRQEKNAVIEILSAVIQYYRVDLDYEKCRRYYEFAENYLFEGAEPYYIKLITHQKAKALMYNSKDLYVCTSEKKSDWGNLDKKEMFDESISLLYHCLPFNLSANLLGRVISTPRRWIKDNGLIERNVKKAFDVYRHALNEMTASENLFVLNGTELMYLIREMLFLLVKFYVYIDENGEVQYYTEKKEFTDICNNFSPSTLDFINQTLEMIEGQSYYLLDWIRGMAALLNKKYDVADRYFKSHENFHMTWIVRYLNGDKSYKEKIDAKLRELSENKPRKDDSYNPESCEDIYYYQDALQIGYNFE